MKQKPKDILSARIAYTKACLRPDSGSPEFNPVFPSDLRRPGEPDRSENNSLPDYLLDIRESFFLPDDIENWHRFELVATGKRSTAETENSFFAVVEYYRSMRNRNYYKNGNTDGKSFADAKEVLIAFLIRFAPEDESQRPFLEDEFTRNEFRALLRFARYCRHCDEIYSSFANDMSWLSISHDWGRLIMPGAVEFRALLSEAVSNEFWGHFLSDYRDPK
ncbi:UNVERIFIED_ORG: hypothetical protein GGD60_005161 [Rhizobium esperanzae]